MRKAIMAIKLNDMPFDRYEDGIGFIHATGREIVFDDGTVDTEYEDNIYSNISEVDEDDYYSTFKGE